MAAIRNTSGAADHSSEGGMNGWLGYALETLRIITIVSGAYFVVAALDIAIALLIAAFGVAIGEAMTWSVMLGFLLYVAILVWAFAAPARHRPASVIFGTALVLSGLAIILTPDVLA